MGKNICLSIMNFTFVICVCSFDSSAQCLTAPFGQKPATTQSILQCNGTYQTISEGCYAGEYTKLNVTAGITYSFKSTQPTDIITISNEAGTAAFAYGTGTTSWTASSTTVIRFYTHNTKGGCGSDNNSKRTRQVSCTAPNQGGGFLITQSASCSFVSIPGFPVVTAITNTTATVSWPAIAQQPQYYSYEFELRTSGSAFSTDAGLVRKWATPAGVTSLEIMGLDPFTGYYVYVRVKCGIGVSATYGAFTYNAFGTLR